MQTGLPVSAWIGVGVWRLKPKKPPCKWLDERGRPMKARNSDLIRNAALLTSNHSRVYLKALLSQQCSCFRSRTKDFEPSPWNHRIDCEYRKLMFRCIELYQKLSDPPRSEVN